MIIHTLQAEQCNANLVRATIDIIDSTDDYRFIVTTPDVGAIIVKRLTESSLSVFPIYYYSDNDYILGDTRKRGAAGVLITAGADRQHHLSVVWNRARRMLNR